MSSPHHHRHFVALPLTLAAVIFVMLTHGALSNQMRASVRGASSSVSDVLSFADGMQIFRGERGVVKTDGAVPELTRGSVLIAHPGIAQIQANGLSLSGLAGAFHVVKNGDFITVSALTTPVLVADGGRRVIVPVGYQWRGEKGLPADVQDGAAWFQARTIEPLPSSFIREQLLTLDTFPDQTPPLPSAVTEIAAPTRFTFFSVAYERAQAAWRDSVLGLLRHYLEQGERSQAHALMTNVEMDPAFADERSVPALAILSAQYCPSVPDVCALLLSRIAVQENLWLPAAYHPALRSTIWSMQVPAVSAEARSLLVFTLLPSDRQPVSLMPVIGPLWEEEAVSLLFASKERESLFVRLAGAHLPVLRRFAQTGFPERAERMIRALRSVAARTGIAIPSALEKTLKDIENTSAQTVDLALLAEPVAEESSASSAESAAPQVKVEHVANVAAALLQGTDMLFTTETRIVPVDDQRAHVSGILFAGSDGSDHAYAFDLNVVDQTVSSVVRDEKEYPNALPLEKFLVWMRK